MCSNFNCWGEERRGLIEKRWWYSITIHIVYVLYISPPYIYIFVYTYLYVHIMSNMTKLLAGFAVLWVPWRSKLIGHQALPCWQAQPPWDFCQTATNMLSISTPVVHGSTPLKLGESFQIFDRSRRRNRPRHDFCINVNQTFQIRIWRFQP